MALSKDPQFKIPGTAASDKQPQASSLKGMLMSFICEKCNYVTGNIEDLLKHSAEMRDKHVKFLKCSYCPYFSKSEKKLVSHVHSAHPKIVKKKPHNAVKADVKRSRLELPQPQKQKKQPLPTFKCPMCPFYSRSQDIVEKHKQTAVLYRHQNIQVMTEAQSKINKN